MPNIYNTILSSLFLMARISINKITGIGMKSEDTSSPKSRVFKKRYAAPRKEGNSKYTLDNLNDCSEPVEKTVEIIEKFAIIEKTIIDTNPKI